MVSPPRPGCLMESCLAEACLCRDFGGWSLNNTCFSSQVWSQIINKSWNQRRMSKYEMDHCQSGVKDLNLDLRPNSPANLSPPNYNDSGCVWWKSSGLQSTSITVYQHESFCRRMLSVLMLSSTLHQHWPEVISAFKKGWCSNVPFEPRELVGFVPS